ncbi:MAG: phosphoglycerate mutase family protein [Lactobacillales bacterium]|jgi:broad specificity phosphatase PhoE|nr:phosphoglycerate mutase family protein [Lactobacillales bacterium]
MIYLIRHAQSLTNIGHRISYPTAEVALTEEGQKQAQLLADTFDISPDLIVYSSYLRARQSAEPLIKKFPLVKTEEWEVAREVHFLSTKAYQNTSKEERKKMINDNFETYGLDYVMGAGAESFNQVVSRAEVFLEKMRTLPEHQNTVIFSHGGIIKILNMILAGKERTMENAFNVPGIKNGQIFELKF